VGFRGSLVKFSGRFGVEREVVGFEGGFREASRLRVVGP